MTCLRCQTRDVAVVLGREEQLIDELYRQLDQRSDPDAVPRVEHERVVAALNETIRARNAQIDNLRRKT